jgi:hypothetical protein
MSILLTVGRTMGRRSEKKLKKIKTVEIKIKTAEIKIFHSCGEYRYITIF